MAKRAKVHRKKSFTLPIAVVAGFVPPAIDLLDTWRGTSEGPKAVAIEACRIFTGLDYWSMQWQPTRLKWGLFPVVGGVLVHKLANKLGVNRLLAQAGVPVIRV